MLNKNIQLFLNQFQTISVSVIAGCILIYVNWKPLEIENEVAILGIRYLYSLLILVGFFILVRIVVSIVSWIDYRNEETELLNEILGEEFRKKPQIKNFWRWDEFYSILIVVLVVILFIVFCETAIIPNMK